MYVCVRARARERESREREEDRERARVSHSFSGFHFSRIWYKFVSKDGATSFFFCLHLKLVEEREEAEAAGI